jgi:hypothetical protein
MYFISMIWSTTCEGQFYFYALVKNIWRLVETTWWEKIISYNAYNLLVLFL